MRAGLALAASALWCAPALAQDASAPDPLAPIAASPPVAPPSAVPPAAAAPQLPPPAPVLRIPRSWPEVFSAIRSGQWREAEAGIAILPASALSPVAKAALYTAPNSPVVPLESLTALLNAAPDLPQAEQLSRLAQLRGASAPPPVHRARQTVWLGNAPGRSRARPVSGDPAADSLRKALEPYVKQDSPQQAEQLLIQAFPALTAEARAEMAQRVGWIYYSVGQDADARRVAESYSYGSAGDWVPHAAWVSGLASWRMGDCNAAAAAFRKTASTTREREFSAGALYWAARAEQACRRPQAVAPLLRAAAQVDESFYGLLAREALGTGTALPPDPHAHFARVQHLPNVQRAVELARIGERPLAEEMLRHQARIGDPSQHHGLIEVAKQLDLAGAQFWLAHNGQPGAVADARDRYPLPRWTPVRGWRVDPALALAHIRQESSFRADAVSPAGAVGLMQVMPGTAADMARATGLPSSRAQLADPGLNMEFGQAFLERIKGSSATAGHLPKVIAAYNAGPLPVGRWAWLDRGDPLLWMESIPYYETRHYVPAVMRNYWVYQGMMGVEQSTLRDLAQHRWPYFPTSREVASTGR